MPDLRPSTTHRHRLPGRLALGVALGAIVLSVFGSAAAQDSIKDARNKRDAAINAKADAAAQINLLRAQDAEVAVAMRSINEAVARQSANVETARAAVAAAEDEAKTRQAEVVRLQGDLGALRAEIIGVFVDDYIGRATNEGDALVRAGSFDEGLRRRAILEAIGTDKRRTEVRLRALDADMRLAAAAAERAVRDAEARRAALAGELATLESRRAQQQKVRTDFERRIAEWRRRQDQLDRDAAQLGDFIKREQARILGVTPNSPIASSTQGFVLPARGKLVSGFGRRTHPIYGDVRMHEGADFDGRTGDPIVAAKEGRVIFAGVRGGYGNVVIVAHGPAVTTVYAHMSAIDASIGNNVGKGELLGRVGSTGLSTGPHLHFEVRINGDAKDPMLFLP